MPNDKALGMNWGKYLASRHDVLCGHHANQTRQDICRQSKIRRNFCNSF